MRHAARHARAGPDELTALAHSHRSHHPYIYLYTYYGVYIGIFTYVYICMHIIYMHKMYIEIHVFLDISDYRDEGDQ